jgi:flagellar L-ring protein precursor FlgH
LRLPLVLPLLTLLLSPLSADSLWSPQGPFASLFADHKAHRIGDIITIIISESAQATHSAAVDHQHEADSQVGPGEGLLDFIRLVGWGGKSESSAKGGSTRAGSLAARVTVSVVGISPAGNLLLEGRRTVKVNEDLQQITITGEVRPRDVAADNTVLSRYVANARIEYSGTEPEHPTRHTGLITKLLNILF